MFDLMEETRKNLDGNLDPESKRYLDRCILERKLDGLHLDEETRNKVKKLKEEISDLQVEFSKNCNEESTKLTFKEDELKGVNSKLLNSLPKNETGDYIVSLKYPVYFPIMKDCKVF
jgi:Zn-dependent oligopeptidase